VAYVAVALGGFIGALLRYGIDIAMGSWNGVNIATLCINWLGCLALGWLNTVSGDVLPLRPNLKLGLGTGLLGAFTTFSTFTVDALKLFHEGRVFTALAYVILSIVGGLCLAYLGYRLAGLNNRLKEQRE
jgi:fluoride exporter